MRRFLAALPACWLAASLLCAADKPTPGAPTREEAAQGWIALFDGESTFGWQAPTGSKWTLAEGMTAPQADKPGLLVTTTAFRNYELLVEYRVRSNTKAVVHVCCDKDGKPRNENKPESTAVELQNLGNQWVEMRLEVHDGRITNTQFRTTGSNQMNFATKTAEVPRVPEEVRPVIGHIALAGNAIVFRNVKLRPLDAKPIFNGKDLTGWKVFKGEKPEVKSEFTVNKEGWLTVRNGPGDLQTEGQWADFLFQGECRTNGKNLNSGVFFRCRPGEYQQGYEAQIHNGLLDTPRKYTVVEFDPKTHALTGKFEVESKLADFGTGAIYNRIPARMLVARDGEWFTLTVLAQGNHIATWVDGVQVVDWTDNRPLSDNARKGCRLEKGSISLQGHDPTTDLNFRKLSVIDLAPKKE